MKNSIGKKTLSKIRSLASYLLEKYGLRLARAISVNPKEMERILKGDEEPSMKVVKRIAEFFCIPLSVLISDDEELPPFEALQLDEDLISIQRNDVQNDIEREKQKHYFSRNWRLLGYRKRIALIISILLITIPLAAYIIFCASEVAYERASDLHKYHIGSDGLIYDRYDPEQARLHANLQSTSRENNPNASYAEVKVGAVLERIKGISSATNSYTARMQIYFIFDKDEFRDMFKVYTASVLMDQVIDDYYASSGEIRPEAIVFSDWIESHQEYFNHWVEANDSRFYPGETPSNVLTDKETMFDIGNGGFVADSYGTVKELEEIQYYDEEGRLRTMCYQKVKFTAEIEKAFDSVRYPLDSVQFKMYIQPTMDAAYIRYVPDWDVNENGDSLSGFTPFFGIGSGYRLIREKDGMKNFVTRLNYYETVNNDPAVDYPTRIQTQLEIIVRANRAGISLFLQAFINLFSVVIWIIIAFYSQSYTGEDSVGMLGTGLFGAISSILVGLSMISDAGIFSLITMINIFTLAVIMIMTYQAIAAKRAAVRKDKVLIAYNGIKLRILFYLLTAATAIMFGIIPCIAYMWGL